MVTSTLLAGLLPPRELLGSLALHELWRVILVPGAVLMVVRNVLAYRRFRARRRRTAEIEASVVVAAENDPKFDPQRLIPLATELVMLAQTAWSEDDRPALGALLGPDLLVEWERRLIALEQLPGRAPSGCRFRSRSR